MTLTLYRLPDGNLVAVIPQIDGDYTVFSNVYNYDPAHYPPYNALSDALRELFGIILPPEREIEWDEEDAAEITAPYAAIAALETA